MPESKDFGSTLKLKLLVYCRHQVHLPFIVILLFQTLRILNRWIMSYEHLLFLLFFSPSNFSQLILRTTIIPCLQNNQISIFCAFFFPRVGIFCAIISIDHIEVKKYVSVLLFDCLTFDWLVVLLTLIMSWRGLQPDPSTKVFGYLFNNPFFSWLFKSEQMMNLSQVLIQVLFYFFPRRA